MLKVGQSKIPFGNVTKILDYNSVEYNEDGFADVNEYTPNHFDLCNFITDAGLHKKGWWTGQSYWGHRLCEKEKVILWKKCKELF